MGSAREIFGSTQGSCAPDPHLRRRLCHLIAASLAICPWIFPQAQAGQSISYFTTGYGRQSCSAYLTASRGLEANAKREFKRERVYVSENAEYNHWIFGFVSAMNYGNALNGNKHPDVQATNEDILGWVQSWCQAHPSNTVIDGTQQFINERWSAAVATAAPAAAVSAPTFVYVAFQPGLSNEDVTSLLRAYNVTIAEGPNANGFYKLRLSSPLSPDDLRQFIESMRTQIKLVKAVVSGR